MKISLYEYLALPDDEQYNIVFNQGFYLDALIKCNTRFVLYSLDLFFVEVEYDSEKNKVVGKRAFVTGDLLSKYTDEGKINL